jgi:hypothetical protein
MNGFGHNFCKVIFLSAGLLAGCSGQTDLQRIQADARLSQMQEYEALQIRETAFAEKLESPAKGTRTCEINQYESAHRSFWVDAGSVRIFRKNGSEIRFRVSRTGAVDVAVKKTTYPGSLLFVKVGKLRTSGRGDAWVRLPNSMVSLIKENQVIETTWPDWPYNSDVNNSDVFRGFEKAYTECLSYLRS